MRSDHWTAPSVSGPPSTANFCTLLVAGYEHEAELPYSASVKISEQILADFLSLVPKIVAEAPPAISAQASYFLDNERAALESLEQAGLNPDKVKAGKSGADLLSPKMAAAGEAVMAFSQKDCHYTIGGSTP